MSRKLVAILVLVSFALAFSGVGVYALGFGDAVKLFGIAFAVQHFSGQLNSFINTLLNQHGVKWEGSTKVVPILSLGRGTYIGAAQVAGPPDLVDKTKAVAQGETRIGGLNGRLLVPISNLNPTKGLSRVKGIGVTATIDFKV
jgi:hypothetical protein